MSIEIKTVNALGLNEIKEFLASHHKKGGEYFSEAMLDAWAADAEFQLAEGNPAMIEIRSWDSVSGATCEYRISDAGLDSETIADEE